MDADNQQNEIELKLFFPATEVSRLTTFLNSLPAATSQGCQQLSNGYYDTPELALRQLDMGLRVRGCDGKREQTIKTAGRVSGGIHCRPEYNVDIDANSPVLSLFPAEIWPENSDIDALQARLACLFHTDFQRCRWLVVQGESLIELALDTGTIAAGGQSESLCELEFELKRGRAADLLPLAQQVAGNLPMRLGKASKAQRGYRLAQQASPLALEALQYISLPCDSDIKATLLVVLETALERWQLLEGMIAESLDDPAGQALLWQRLRSCVRLLRLTLGQFTLGNSQTDAGFFWLEQQLAFVTEANSLTRLAQDKLLLGKLANAESVRERAVQQLQKMDFRSRLQALWQDCRYGQLQLQLVNMLLELASGEMQIAVAGGLKGTCDGLQEASWQKLLAAMPGDELSRDDYLKLAAPLDEGILVGLAYGSLYSSKARDSFRAPWQDLSQGIISLGAYAMAEQLAPELAEALADKQQSLIFAMEQSRKMALQQQPYWR
ncbi:CYTH domain-containing protein [Shewanella algae]|uniref:CYTH domain-containing protein n=1 Tax=Shewanella algae TaxID=38313 RepID=UPI00214B7C71|nr:CYTH and CHAD domain-containing protein [Shewanella algae]